MKEVTIYTANYCGFCESAKRFFEQKQVPFKTVNLELDPELRESLSRKHNWRTVPMIFIGSDFIGGFQDLIKLDSTGKLNEKLGM
jgi:glutaredoxin 3